MFSTASAFLRTVIYLSAAELKSGYRAQEGGRVSWWGNVGREKMRRKGERTLMLVARWRVGVRMTDRASLRILADEEDDGGSGLAVEGLRACCRGSVRLLITVAGSVISWPFVVVVEEKQVSAQEPNIIHARDIWSEGSRTTLKYATPSNSTKETPGAANRCQSSLILDCRI